ncbi:ebp domain containing protein [Sporothrix brasiliensis 5110]|uniref:Ebp domain containing protein n=1 Tax=Sporothrix brasiliensis 5110 TaxID=1398154 RepID=A0A0C2IQJ2_9PEZI|nr:ebp domain containing protein [Sporothrix brasiliensis 5110]KIH89150.1 ebp domain containing protein [Sporothrix brasiliensis 5110]
MASTTASAGSLPPDLFDTTTLVSLAACLVFLAAGYAASRRFLPHNAKGSTRVLFIWHAFDALIHLILEASFLYHCFFSWIPVSSVSAEDLASKRFYMPEPSAFLGRPDRIYGPQAGAIHDQPLAKLWMVYARADRRWGGPDLGVISLELLTVLFVGPMAVWICYEMAMRRSRVNVLMIIVATAELYGGFMTFCPEWLVLNDNLDCSNFMYKWVYIVFFNTLWVWLPLYALYVAIGEIQDAFAVRDAVAEGRKLK